MFLISLANILPRRASMTAFLCLVVAHLEWPDISGSSLSVLRRRRRPGRGRARGCGRRRSTSGWNDVASSGPCRTATILPAASPRPTRASTSTPGPTSSTQGARMNTACTGSSRPRDVEVALEGVHLAAEGVAAHGDVEPAEGLLARGAVLDPVGQHDHPGAGAERRHARRRSACAAARSSPKPARELGHRGRLPAGDHQAVARLELLRATYGEGAATPSRSSTARCSRTSPCRARTPMVGRACRDPRSVPDRPRIRNGTCLMAA